MRIDVWLNGVRWLVDQSSTNDAVWTRVRGKVNQGATIQILPHAAAPAPAHPTVLERASQSVLFFATVTDDACMKARARWHGRFALSADPAYAPTEAQLNILRSSGLPIDAWGNQNEIGAEIEAFRVHHRLDRSILQSETEAECTSWRPTSGLASIGNPNAWSPANRTTITIDVDRGDKALIAEVYNGRPDTYSSQGVPVCSFCLGVAMDGGVHYPLAGLLARCPAGARSTYSVWHAAGLTDADWAAIV